MAIAYCQAEMILGQRIPKAMIQNPFNARIGKPTGRPALWHGRIERHQFCNLAPTARDHDFLACLDTGKEARHVRFGFMNSDCLHDD